VHRGAAIIKLRLSSRAPGAVSVLAVLAGASACEPKSSAAPLPDPSRNSSMAPPLGSAPVESDPLDAGSLSERGLLTARPSVPSSPSTRKGKIPLGLGGARDGFVYVPANVSSTAPAPLLVFFHGAGGNAAQAEMVRALADEHGTLLLSIDSRDRTWDVIVDEVGPDVAFLDRALRSTFERFAVDPSRITVSGFSDGASYALTLGLANGELFRNVVAFSPGFSLPPELHGKPRVFVSHGKDDAVLPIDRTSRRIVPRLERSGYDVRYVEFDGPHTVPSETVRAASTWLVG